MLQLLMTALRSDILMEDRRNSNKVNVHIGANYMRERIIALLDSQDKVEMVWKQELIDFVKMKRDYDEKIRKECFEKWLKREKELDDLEAEAEKLREKGLCRVQFDPYVVKYRRRNGDNVNIRMNLLKHYPDSILEPVVEDFKNSILIEELDAMAEIVQSMAENARREKEKRDKAYDDLLARHLEKELNEKG